MDRDLLRGWLEDGLSLNEIAEIVTRDPSTVGYWVKKHGLKANGRSKHAARGGLAVDELRSLAEAGHSVAEIARMLDRSPSTVRYWIDRYALPTPRNLRHTEVQELVNQGIRTVVKVCRRHGRTEFALVGAEHRPRCKRCRAEAVMRRRRRVKALLVEEAGGRCAICGFDSSLMALEFHHLDPAMKSFGLAHRGITRSIARVRQEAAKCVLLCSNCHAQVEAGEIEVPVRCSKAIASPA